MNNMLNVKEKLMLKEYNFSSESIYYVSYLVYLSATLLFNISTMENFFGIDTDILANIFVYPVYLVLIFKILFMQKYTKKELIKLICIGICVLVSSILSRSNMLLVGFLFIVAAKNIDFNKIVKITLLVQIICISIIIMLALTGVIENRVMIRSGDTELRYALGFEHPNTFASQILQMIVCWIWIRWDRLCVKDYVGIIILAVIVKLVCDSKTNLLLIGLILICILAAKLADKIVDENKIIKYSKICAKLVIIIGPILSLIMAVIYKKGNTLHFILNKVFSGRLMLLQKFYNEYGFSLLGQKINRVSTFMARETGQQVAVLDNAYGNLAIRYGIIILLLFVIGYYILVKSSLLDKQILINIIVFIYFIFGISETQIFKLPHNVSLILLSTVIYCNRGEQELNIIKHTKLYWKLFKMKK